MYHRSVWTDRTPNKKLFTQAHIYTGIHLNTHTVDSLYLWVPHCDHIAFCNAIKFG